MATFAELESLVRGYAQAFMQSVLDDDVVELLGRGKSERRAEGTTVGYRNGYGDERRRAGAIRSRCSLIERSKPKPRNTIMQELTGPLKHIIEPYQ